MDSRVDDNTGSRRFGIDDVQFEASLFAKCGNQVLTEGSRHSGIVTSVNQEGKNIPGFVARLEGFACPLIGRWVAGKSEQLSRFATASIGGANSSHRPLQAPAEPNIQKDAPGVHQTAPDATEARGL